jgi:predicted DNA-binding transcriptional regulator YafY
MAEEPDIDLGINPKKINETEARQLALVLNLLRNPGGLNFKRIRNLMADFYQNPVEESDQKKLHRDIEELSNLGFSIKFYRVSESSDNLYKIDIPVEEKKLQFSKDELATLSVTILSSGPEEFSNELYTACQKIFHQNMHLFPFQSSKPQKSAKELDPSSNQCFLQILKAIKTTTPLKITYFKNTPEDKTDKEIDPIHITKRNHNDFYLIAYDRQKKEKRRYLIPKILKVQELGGEYILSHKIQKEDLNYHALNFRITDNTTIKLKTEPRLNWKLENYLHPHPFEKIENTYIIQTSNPRAIFGFLWKEPNVVKEILPEKLFHEFLQYLESMHTFYEEV